MASKVEFAVQITCESCVEVIKNSLKDVEGIKSVDVQLENESVVVESTLATDKILEILESTGRKAVIKGYAGSIAGVVIIECGSIDIKGVIRFMQITSDTCIVDGTIDGMEAVPHSICVHECGDISQACKSVGSLFIPENSPDKNSGILGTVIPDKDGRASFRFTNNNIHLSDIIENDTELVTGYLEPPDPLRLARNVNIHELLEAYEVSCFRHDTKPNETILNQINDFEINNLRSDKLTLNTDTLTSNECESLEEIFKRVQFTNIYFEGDGFTTEIAYPLFEMFEYYESAIHLDINFGDSIVGIRGMQAVGRYIKNSNTLQEFSALHLRLNGREYEALIKPLDSTINLQILKLSNCHLAATRLTLLVNGLIQNKTIKELYLPHNFLEKYEAEELGRLLHFNKRIQLLDLSNNSIEDAGVEHLVRAILSGTEGLEVLVLWCNKLTIGSAKPLSILLTCYPSLTVLNVGCNILRCEFITRMTEALTTNMSLQRLDTNKTLVQLDLSVIPDLPGTPQDHELVIEMDTKCQANRRRQSSLHQVSTHRPVSRKISLTCQTLQQDFFPMPLLLTEPKKVAGKLRSPAPSPIPSPVSSPLPMITKSRFSVSRVSESECQASQAFSRFKVSVVESTKSITSNSGAVTIGFDCQNPDSSKVQSEQNNGAETQDSATSSVSEFQDSDRPSDNVNSLGKTYVSRSDETVKPLVSDIRAPSERNVVQNISIPKPEEKPMTSLEKLLSLFQIPPPLFNRNNQQPPTVDKKESLNKTKNQLFTKTSENIQFLPFSNTNISKSVTNISNISDLSKSDIDAQSVKENISPEHSLSLFSSKAKSYDDYQGKCASQLSALDSGVCKEKPEFVCSHLCSSSEESDSGLTGLESTTSSISVTDSGINEDTATTYDSSRPSQADSKKSRSSETDLTNNNSWKPPNNNDDMETQVVIPQDGITGWQSEND
ncbi:uncharacterized protein CBL_14081 [Carabus blaptoides fortunei]